MLADVRYALRALRAHPGFTVAAILTLALGIGANTAIFSVAWQVLLKPLPFPDEDRLVVVWQTYGKDARHNLATPGNYRDWRDDNRAFQSVAAWSRYTQQVNLTGGSEPQALEVANLSGNYFGTLGIGAVLGRTLLPADGAGENAASVLVLSESAWRAKFGADPAVVGRTVGVNGERYEIVGVVPDTTGIGSVTADAWAPMAFDGEFGRQRQAFFLGVIGRLRAGVTLAQADEDVRRVSGLSAAASPSTNRDLSGTVVGLRQQLTAAVRPAVLMLAAGAALVLLIACANMAGLQLARHTARRRELAMRSALGASRARIIRELAIEGLLLAAIAAYAGLMLGAWALATLSHFVPPTLARGVAVRPDLIVAAYTVLLAVVTGVAVSAVPAMRATGGPAAAGLGGRSDLAANQGAGIRTILVGAEVAMALVLLIGAGLLITSLLNVLRVNPGFDFSGGVVVDLVLPNVDYPDAPAKAAFFDRAMAAIRSVPGVEGVCAVSKAPLDGQHGGMTFVPDGERRLVGATPTTVSPQCMDVLRIPVTRGRMFRADEPAAALVSESMARELFKGGDPLGRRIHVGLPTGPVFTIVGVTRDIRAISLESGYPNQVWLTYHDAFFDPRQLLVRASVPPAALIPVIRDRVRALDPRLPVSTARTMDDLRDSLVAERRFNMQLLVEFGVVAVLLCALGIYGLLAQVVGYRTAEIGVRLALGARPGQVVRQVLGSTAAAVLCGAAAGTLTAWLLSRAMQRFLFRVAPASPMIYGASILLIFCVALFAAWAPARRASRLDPIIALRRD